MIVRKCDVCGAEPAQERRFWVDRAMDGAGSMDNNEHESMDLCADHSWEAFVACQRRVKWEAGQIAYSHLRSLIRHGEPLDSGSQDDRL